FVPHSRPCITKNDISSVTKALKRNFVGHGTEVKRLEKYFSLFLGRKYCIAVNSGSGALKLSLLASGIKKGSKVATSVHVCPAVANVMLELGLKPVFIDVDNADVNISIDLLREEIRRTASVSAIVLPYLGGYVKDISGISSIGIPLIEDCAVSIGAAFYEEKIGKKGRFAVFSFGSTKLVTGGSGGMVCTDNKKDMERIRALMNYDYMAETGADFHVRLNCNMNDVQAALALSQMKRLSKTLKYRTDIAKLYAEILHGKEGITLPDTGNSSPAYHRFVFFAKERNRLIDSLKRSGIDARPTISHFMFDYFNLKKSYENSYRLKKELASLPIYPGLTKIELNAVIKGLRKAVG
ncbi:MAG: DegT/DnrJ/EryC1/StrS aminotransferase family protein, partial [Candidatus Omnitrophica bacterium]|nr:DegT/DnrJ/EryC1/StrS aminotransferase family protein [Candidatus Omnitrophota bacterium]